MTLADVAIGCFSLLFAGWVMYPSLMWLAARVRPMATPDGPDDARVHVVIATRDAPALVAQRVANVLASTYPPALLSVVVAVDVTTRFTLAEYTTALRESARVTCGDAPGGKAATLNAGMRAAQSADVVVFADVGQSFERDTIRRLVGYLNDSRFGAVTGRYVPTRSGTLMTAYARFEAMIRAGQSVRSVVSTSGSIYAIQRSLWRPLPCGLICDDLFTTMSVVRQGKRVGFCRDAVALDARRFTQDQQFARRARTLTGLVQFCSLDPSVLLPWKNPIWIHFVLHKILRLLTPVLLMTGSVALFALAARQHGAALVGVLAGTGVTGVTMWAIVPTWYARTIRPATWALRLQLVPAVALLNGIRRRWTWQPETAAIGMTAARSGEGTY